ncbi:hypothetical protein CHUAL_011948 [Chamberlinius hualienensis]
MLRSTLVILSAACLALTVASPRNTRQAAAAGHVECTCVPYFLCRDDNSINTNGEGLLDVRVKTVGTTPPPEIQAKGNPCGTFEVCCTAPENDPVVTTPPSYVPQCGRRHLEGLDTRILNPFLGKDEAKFAEFPWQAAVLRKEGTLNIFLCGATLIHKKFVLTAIHCIQNLKPDAVKVRLGEYDTQSTGERYPFQDVNVREIITHPGFYKPALYNDIALLFLDGEGAAFAPNVDTACLPDQGQNFDGQTCVITGWGKNAFDPTGEYQNLLKKVEVPVINHKLCQDMFRKTRLGKFFEFHESFICAGGEAGKDACKGDGGGPLVCEFQGSYRVAGIVAWGIGCGQANVPGAYVNVAGFRKWIDEEMGKRLVA